MGIFSKTGLTSSVAAEREAAVEATRRSVEAARDERIRQAEAQLAAAHERHDEELAAAKAAALARSEELDKEIGREVQSRIQPLVTAWTKEPSRGNAMALVTAWRELNDRALREVGSPLASWLSREILVAHGFEDLAWLRGWKGAGLDFQSATGGMADETPWLPNGTIVEVEAGLTRLEARLLQQAREAAGWQTDKAREIARVRRALPPRGTQLWSNRTGEQTQAAVLRAIEPADAATATV
jgi:hypothetical protein